MTSIHSFVQATPMASRSEAGPSLDPSENGDFATIWQAEDVPDDVLPDKRGVFGDVDITEEEPAADIAHMNDPDTDANDPSDLGLPEKAAQSADMAPAITTDVEVAAIVDKPANARDLEPQRIDDADKLLDAAVDKQLATQTAPGTGVLDPTLHPLAAVAAQGVSATMTIDQPADRLTIPHVPPHGTVPAQPTVPPGNIVPADTRSLAASQDEQPKTARGKTADMVYPVSDQRHNSWAVVPRETTAGPAPLPTSPQTPSGPALAMAPLPVDTDEPRLFSTEQILSQSASSSFAALRAANTNPMQAHAPQVAQQVVAATVQSRTGNTEITLNPEELGRVRMSLTSTDAGISVSIIAERPETADLMRRNIELLMREFREFGYGEATFSFGDQSDGPTQDEGRGTSDQTEKILFDQPLPHPTTTATVALRGGLDLKL